jgi:hypothetical protein
MYITRFKIQLPRTLENMNPLKSWAGLEYNQKKKFGFFDFFKI